MLDRLMKFYSPPHYDGDENLSLTTFSLHYTLLATGISAAAYLFFILVVNPSLYSRIILIAALFPLIFLFRWLMHLGRVRLAKLLYVVSLFSVMALQSIKDGGVHAPAFNGIFLAVLAAYLLLGFRSGVVFALLTLITGAGLIIAERYEWISPVVQIHTSVSLFITQIIYLVGALTLLYLTSRAVERSEIQARHAVDLMDESLAAQSESEIRYRAIVEDQTEFINRFTPDGTVLFVNEAYARLFNKRPEELIGQSQKSFLPKRELKNIAEAQAKLSPINPVTMDTYRFITSDGEERWLQWHDRLFFDGSGKPIECQGIGRDITEQKQSQIALQESEERFRAVFEHSPSLIAMFFSETKKFTQANPAFCEMVGYSLEELRELSLTQITHPDDITNSEEGIRQLADGTNQLLSMEKRYITKSGDTVWVSTSTRLLRDRQKTPIYGLIVEQNITERKKSEAIVQKQLSELSTLHSVSSLGLETLNEDEIFERVTKIIGEMLYPDHFGILLLDEGSDELYIHPSYHGLPKGFLGFKIKRGEGITGQVVQTEKPMRYDDVLDVESFIRSTPGIRSAISVPLNISGHLYGVLNAESKQVAYFSNDDERALVTIADLLVTLIEKSRLVQASQSLAQELESLYQAALATSRLVEPKQFLALVYEEVKKSIPLDIFIILLHDEEAAELEIALAVEDDIVQEEAHGLRYSLSSELPAVWTIQNEETLLLSDIEISDSLTVINISPDKTPKSLLSVPLKHGEGVIGAICLHSLQSHTYTKNHQRFLESLALQISTGLINDQLFLAEKQQRTMAEALHDTAMVIGSTLDFEEVLNRILDNVGRVVPHDAANIMIIEDGSLTTSIIASRGYVSGEFTHEDLAALEFQLTKSPTFERMIQTRQSLIIPDVRKDENWVHYPETAWIRSYVGAPIIIDDTVVGFVNLDSVEEDFFNSTHAKNIEAFAHQVAIAIANARLYQELEKHSTLLEQEVDFATEEMRLSKERLEIILDNSPDAILLLDLHGTIEMTNEALSHLFGYRQVEVLNQSLILLVDHEHKKGCSNLMEAVLEQRTTLRKELLALRKDGTTFDIELALAPLLHESSVYGFVSSMRDVTAIKAVEQMKDAFVSNVSHELRTPITSLKLNHSLLGLDPQKQDVYLGRLGREINRLNELIEDLLRLSRLDQDTAQLERATIDLNDLTAQIVEDRMLIAKENGLILTFEAQEKSVDLIADPGLLGQVLSVLLTNAINYTPSGESITVSTHTKESDGMQWSGFRVSDTGPGISAGDLPHLFNRFYRGKTGHDSGAPGTGLGLAIAKEIIERHQGVIEVVSEGQDKGAEFAVWIPLIAD